MQFPGNGVHPGHRVTVVSSGVRQRLVVGVLLSASGNDKGHLARALQEARRVLRQAGLPASARLQVAADAGYWSEEDLRFAALNRDWVDVLLKESSPTGPLANEPGMLRREAFEFQPSTRAVVCPAGRTMQGPVRNDFDSCEVYSGVGCADCPQRARCTRGPYRKLTVRWDYERFRQAMRQRMSQPGAVARYNQRIATVEPVFASLEHDMRFRRLSSRHPPTVRAEVLLKLLAHNIRRLLTCSRLFCARIVLDAPASLVAWQPASWPRYSAQTSCRTGFEATGPGRGPLSVLHLRVHARPRPRPPSRLGLHAVHPCPTVGLVLRQPGSVGDLCPCSTFASAHGHDRGPPSRLGLHAVHPCPTVGLVSGKRARWAALCSSRKTSGHGIGQPRASRCTSGRRKGGGWSSRRLRAPSTRRSGATRPWWPSLASALRSWRASFVFTGEWAPRGEALFQLANARIAADLDSPTPPVPKRRPVSLSQGHTATARAARCPCPLPPAAASSRPPRAGPASAA
uniref:transposase n=1 Tax=Corallococcus coralloides TaxID=184914 RepID=UPI003D337BB4